MDKRDIMARLVSDASQTDLHFQTHAAVTVRVRRALDDPDISVAAVAKLIQAEPVLAARVVAVANSAAFDRSGRAIVDVRSAVARLGFRNVRSLATAFLVRQMGGGKDVRTGGSSGGSSGGSKDGSSATQRRMAAQLWQHTAHVSALAQVLARRVTHVDPEAALFAGIIHEVGGFYAISRAADYPGLLDGNPADWNEPELLDLEIELGRAVLRALAVPDAALAVLEDFWAGFLALPPRTLADTLLLAEDLAPVASPFHEVKTLPSPAGSAEVGAAASIEVIIGADTLSAILKESAEEVGSLAAALQL
jgi:hypothetical protein